MKEHAPKDIGQGIFVFTRAHVDEFQRLYHQHRYAGKNKNMYLRFGQFCMNEMPEFKVFEPLQLKRAKGIEELSKEQEDLLCQLDIIYNEVSEEIAYSKLCLINWTSDLL